MKKFSFLAVLFCLLFLPSCATTKNSEDFYVSDQNGFSYSRLSNSIPVYFKKSSNRIVVIRMVFEGGTPFIAREKAGIEELTFDLMLHGSKNYSYEDIQNLQYNLSFSMNCSSGKDYSVAGIKCIDRDLISVLEVFADGIKNPLFLKSDFDQFMIENEHSLASTLSDPSGMLGIELQKAVYAGHSYETPSNITEESLKSITIEDVKNHYKKLMDSKRIKIVVIGNFDSAGQKKITALLDKHFGKIEAGEYVPVQIEKIKTGGQNIFVKNPQAGSTGYSIGYFDCPERYDNDYVPYVISTMYLDDILFAKVREEKGALYSVGTGVIAGKEMLGAISAYKISDTKNVFKYIDEAIKAFPEKQEVEQKLESYKNKYITTLFNSSQNATGVAANMITSLEYGGKWDRYLERSSQVQKVTADDVIEAYRKYILNGKIRWVIVTQ